MAIDMVKNKFNQCKCGYKLIFMDIDMPGIDGC
jgi:CheY-like chemotaxis protein